MGRPSKPKKPQAKGLPARSVRGAVGFALGGIGYCILMLGIGQWVGQMAFTGRLLSEKGSTAIVLFLMCCTNLPGALLYVWAVSRPIGLPFGLLFRNWLWGMTVLWLLSLYLKTVPGPVFILYWALLAWWRAYHRLPLTATVAKVPPPRPVEGALRHESHSRIPAATERLLAKLVAQVAEVVESARPGGAKGVTDGAATRILLDGILKTWWAGQRRSPLGPDDVAQLTDCVAFARSLGDDSVEGQAVFRAVLAGLVADWTRPQL